MPTIKRKKFLFIELFIVLAILVAAFMVYTHVFCPDGSTWKTDWFVFELSHYSSMTMYCFILLLFMSKIIFLSTWYMTCKFWWKFIVFILLILAIYKFVPEVTYQFVSNKELEEVIDYSLTGVLALLFYLLSRFVNYPLRARLVMDSINAEDLLKYKIKSTRQYSTMLNRLNEDVLTYDLSNLKEIVAQAVLMSKEEKKEGIRAKLKNTTVVSVVIVCMLVLAPICNNIQRIVPSGAKTLDLGLFTITSFPFSSIEIFFWIAGEKFSLFIVITIWFLTCMYWWKYFLLVPLTMVSYQIFTVLNANEQYMDEKEIWHALPVLSVLLAFLLWVSFKIGNYNKIQHLKDKIKVETFKIISFLANEKEDDDYESTKMELKEIMTNKDQYKPDDYLKRLEELQTKLAQKNT